MAAIFLDHRVRRDAFGSSPVLKWLTRDLLFAAGAGALAWMVAGALVDLGSGRLGALLAVISAAAIAFVGYATAQILTGAPEFRALGVERLPLGRWLRRGEHS